MHGCCGSNAARRPVKDMQRTAMTPDESTPAHEPHTAGPLILALETSSTACSVALGDGRRIHVDHRVAPREHAQLLLPMIDALLTDAHVDAAALDAIAWGHGPGSFTGLRIAAAVTQAIAWANDLPVIGASSLEVLALSGLAASAVGSVPFGSIDAHDASAIEGVVALVDARMGELYWNAFRREGDALMALGPDRLQRPEALLDAFRELGQRRWLLVGDGIAAVPPDTLMVLDVVASLPDMVPDARWLLPEARRRLLAGEGQAAATAAPVYLRDERAWRRLDEPPRNESR